jgi:uroporphyrinogen decarboxylase
LTPRRRRRSFVAMSEPMTDRERFLRTMRYQEVDRRPLHVVGAWKFTRDRWETEGLPEGVDVHEYLGVTPMRLNNISCNTWLCPPYESKLLREDDEFVYRQDEYGRTARYFKDHDSMPEWIDFPVKTPEDLRRVMDEHYRVDDLDARFAPDWADKARAAGEADNVVLIDGGCYYWTLRSLAGVETASYLLYDAYDTVDELFERYFTVCMEHLRRAVKLTTIDVIGFGEDIAYKNGPLMSPEMFRKLIKPRYRKIMDFAHEHGIDLTWYDSDGDIRLLIPDHLEVGVNSSAPTEVAAGMVPVELRRQFGRELRIIGGIDKRAVAAGREAIDAEIDRNRPLIAEGGFLPAIDHSVSSDISFDDYRYFLDRLTQALALEG